MINETDDNCITFITNEKEMLRLSGNGDIYIRGKLSGNDLEVVEALKGFIFNSKETGEVQNVVAKKVVPEAQEEQGHNDGSKGVDNTGKGLSDKAGGRTDE